MEIKTKYAVGDMVWVNIEGNNVNLRVKAISLYTNGRFARVNYEFVWNERALYVAEQDVHATNEMN